MLSTVGCHAGLACMFRALDFPGFWIMHIQAVHAYKKTHVLIAQWPCLSREACSWDPWLLASSGHRHNVWKVFRLLSAQGALLTWCQLPSWMSLLLCITGLLSEVGQCYLARASDRFKSPFYHEAQQMNSVGITSALQSYQFLQQSRSL